MEEQPQAPTAPVPQNKDLLRSLVEECRIMLNYALKNGKTIDAQQVAPLDETSENQNVNAVLGVYNYLSELVKPALPGTLILFHKNRASKDPLRFLGPLPIVRQFMALSIISLIALIVTSLSGEVNPTTIQLSMLQGKGLSQILRFLFLISAASVGAAFFALFEMNNYISTGTFDPKYSSIYWSRFVLGIVSGILLSELFVVFIEPSEQTTESGGSLSSATYLLKPILAILGGFSASLVYRILNRLISAIESIFTGSANQMIAQKQQEFDLAKQANEQQLKGLAAQNLLALKQKLVQSNVSQSVIDQIDTSLAQLISTPLPKSDNTPPPPAPSTGS